MVVVIFKADLKTPRSQIEPIGTLCATIVLIKKNKKSAFIGPTQCLLAAGDMRRFESLCLVS